MRYVLGPTAAYEIDATPPPVVAPPAKADVVVSIASINPTAVKVAIPAYDLAVSNKLMEVRAYLLLSGQPVPDNAAGYVGSQIPFATLDTSAIQAGQEVTITLPSVAPGKYLCQLVMGFDA